MLLGSSRHGYGDKEERTGLVRLGNLVLYEVLIQTLCKIHLKYSSGFINVTKLFYFVFRSWRVTPTRAAKEKFLQICCSSDKESLWVSRCRFFHFTFLQLKLTFILILMSINCQLASLKKIEIFSDFAIFEKQVNL